MQLYLSWETQDPVFFKILTIQESKSTSASAASILAIPFNMRLLWVSNIIVCNTLSAFKKKPSQVEEMYLGHCAFTW